MRKDSFALFETGAIAECISKRRVGECTVVAGVRRCLEGKTAASLLHSACHCDFVSEAEAGLLGWYEEDIL